VARSETNRPDHFAENLRTLCRQAPSVAHVCRQLDFNRQQFARYLNGATLPSLHNIRRICDYFGVDDTGMFLPPERFQALISGRPATPRRSPSLHAGVLEAIDLPVNTDFEGALKYVGYYFRYLRSVEYPGMIIKAAVKVFADRGRVRTKAIERLRPEQGARGRHESFKYAGLLMLLTDRVFMVETDVLLGNAIIQTILHPSVKYPIELLFGEGFGISSGPSREPYMTPIVYEFIGLQPDLRAVLRQCRLYAQESPAIDDRVRNFALRRERV
jgi:hypothetical protein